MKRLAAILTSSTSVAVSSLFALPAMAQTTDRPIWGYGHMWDGGWGHPVMGIFGMLFMLLVLVGIVAAAVWLARTLGHPRYGYEAHDGPGRGQALHILAERFARGEIDKAEFEEKRRMLTAR